jgi:hypothetical protein
VPVIARPARTATRRASRSSTKSKSAASCLASAMASDSPLQRGDRERLHR